jgi:hypothetical protein
MKSSGYFASWILTQFLLAILLSSSHSALLSFETIWNNVATIYNLSFGDELFALEVWTDASREACHSFLLLQSDRPLQLSLRDAAAKDSPKPVRLDENTLHCIVWEALCDFLYLISLAWLQSRQVEDRSPPNLHL